MIVAHEQEHVRAGDPWLIHAACLAVAAMPWNAALWWQLRRLRMAVETDCDRRVLAGGVDLGAYGTMLIDMQSRVVKPSFAAPRSSSTPEDLMGIGGMGKGLDRGESNGPGAPDTPISQSTFV